MSIDTIAVKRRLEKAGLDSDQAEAIAQEIFYQKRDLEELSIRVETIMHKSNAWLIQMLGTILLAFLLIFAGLLVWAPHLK